MNAKQPLYQHARFLATFRECPGPWLLAMLNSMNNVRVPQLPVPNRPEPTTIFTYPNRDLSKIATWVFINIKTVFFNSCTRRAAFPPMKYQWSVNSSYLTVTCVNFSSSRVMLRKTMFIRLLCSRRGTTINDTCNSTMSPSWKVWGIPGCKIEIMLNRSWSS